MNKGNMRHAKNQRREKRNERKKKECDQNRGNPEKYFIGTTLKNQNSIQEEIKSRMKLGNACYCSVQNLLSTSLLSKTLKVKIYRTIILPVVLYGCETWSLTLR